ncbi:hypothetical protein KY338_00985 [Candidatus Woesearchaeota archaeon]|nr:hypothetical protein [Candidatus Woesearchaeota archaeon]MBW3006172.1 hypothetical protein [Candidatus Woesearchaeota archaeon]
MNKKIIFGILFVLIIIFIIYLYLATRPIEVYYPDDPAEWVEKLDSETSEINIDYVSKGQAINNERNLYFFVNGSETSMTYEGLYKGNYFTKYYSENGAVLMRVGPEMKPGDGVLDGLLVERVINDTFQVFIFLDDDWKNAVPYTNIVWGKDYSLARPFVFTEISPGIYMDQIEDDPERFGYNYGAAYSGISVTSATHQQVKDGVTEGITEIMFQ